MNWTELLKTEIAGTYDAAEGLLNLVDDSDLDWKPATGTNWMTVGQLLYHIQAACGFCCKGFVTGDWGMPPEEMLPPAEKLPTIGSVAEAKKLLSEDRALALQMIDQAGEERLANEDQATPWAPDKSRKLGHQLLHMIGHLESHKHQLYYYLKLQGKPVNTSTLWGM